MRKWPLVGSSLVASVAEWCIYVIPLFLKRNVFPCLAWSAKCSFAISHALDWDPIQIHHFMVYTQGTDLTKIGVIPGSTAPTQQPRYWRTPNLDAPFPEIPETSVTPPYLRPIPSVPSCINTEPPYPPEDDRIMQKPLWDTPMPSFPSVLSDCPMV